MTRKTIPGLGVILPSDHPDCTEFIAPTTPEAVFSSECPEDQAVESPCNQITESSPDAGADYFSFVPPSSVRSPNNLSLEGALTPTSSKAVSPHCWDVPPPSKVLWTNPFIAVDKATMPPEFSVNQYPPFLDPMETLGVQRYDVIKIRNVPFSVTIAEIKSFVGRLTSSPLIRDHIQGYPVHIIMERPTGKTMDCYIEFQNKGAGKAAVYRAEQIQFEGRALKIGSRHVDVEASCEGELCAALFPRAKSVLWDRETGIPEVIINQDPFSEGFQGFFTIEEITSVCKHAATPQKSTFNQRCQQRVYESMISTVYKFPWHVPQHYSVNARNFLWSAYMELLQNLVARVLPSDNPSPFGPFEKEVGLSHNLLLEYVFAGLNVQMFSLRQKLMIVEASGSLGPGFEIPPQAVGWPFQTLIPPANYPTEVLNKWLYILEVGYEKCIAHGISHGREDFIQVSRDDLNYLKVELNDAGRAMNFANLISMEKGLMRMLVEQGRMELCRGWNIPYQPFNWPDQASRAIEPSPFWSGVNTTHHSRAVSNNGFQISDKEFSEREALNPNDSDQRVLPDEDDSAKGLMNLKLYNPSAAGALSRASPFNPNTPSFVPSQPWSGERQGTLQPPGGLKRAGMHGLSSSFNPASTFAKEAPVARSTSATQTPPAALTRQPGLNTDATPYDPFSGDVSSFGLRRPSVQPTPRAASGPSGNVGIFGTPSNRLASGAQHSGSPFDSIWTNPPLGEAYEVAFPAIGAPSRRAVSAESAIVRESFVTSPHINPGNVLQTKWKASSSVSASASPAEPSPSAAPDMQLVASTLDTLSITSDAQPTKSAPTDPTIPLPQPQLSAANGLSRIWSFGSPTRGLRSRSSTSRNAFQIQATIHEEGDVSATGRADDVDDAAGGVSLQG